MDAQMQALYLAVRQLLRSRGQARAARQALARAQRGTLNRWDTHHYLDELADHLARARASQQQAEQAVLARWEEFNADY